MTVAQRAMDAAETVESGAHRPSSSSSSASSSHVAAAGAGPGAACGCLSACIAAVTRLSCQPCSWWRPHAQPVFDYDEIDDLEFENLLSSPGLGGGGGGGGVTGGYNGGGGGFVGYGGRGNVASASARPSSWGGFHTSSSVAFWENVASLFRLRHPGMSHAAGTGTGNSGPRYTAVPSSMPGHGDDVHGSFSHPTAHAQHNHSTIAAGGSSMRGGPRTYGAIMPFNLPALFSKRHSSGAVGGGSDNIAHHHGDEGEDDDEDLFGHPEQDAQLMTDEQVHSLTAAAAAVTGSSSPAGLRASSIRHGIDNRSISSSNGGGGGGHGSRVYAASDRSRAISGATLTGSRDTGNAPPTDTSSSIHRTDTPTPQPASHADTSMPTDTHTDPVHQLFAPVIDDGIIADPLNVGLVTTTTSILTSTTVASSSSPPHPQTASSSTHVFTHHEVVDTAHDTDFDDDSGTFDPELLQRLTTAQ